MVNIALVRVSFWRMPCGIAAGVAVVAGLLLVLMGGGHVWGVLAQSGQAGQSMGRLASLIAVGFVLAGPGVLGVALSPGLWRGSLGAYVACIASAAALTTYLVYLLIFVAPNSTGVGSELDYAIVIVGVYLAVLLAGYATARAAVRRRSTGI